MLVSIEEIMFFDAQNEKHICIPHTIIWHDENYFRYEYYCGNYNQPAAKIKDTKRLYKVVTNNCVLLFDENHDFSPNLNKHIATALPPLPKNPEVKSTSFYSVNFGKLIDLYRAHGLRVCCKIEGEGHVNGLRQKYDDCGFYELDGYRQNRTFHFRETECNSGDWGYIIRRITHAIDEQGNRIEIAIKD